MEEWVKVSLFLCAFGLVRETRPSEPYVSEFILGPWRNITEETINKDVYPVGTYSYLSQLVIVFLITDYLKYKPLIILSSLAGISLYSIQLWTESLLWLQVSQFCYGLFRSTEVAYYTYMFAKVEQDRYERVASWSRAAILLGEFISGALSQILISFKVMDFRQLYYITLSAQLLSLVWAIVLPSVNRSVYFHREVTTPLTGRTSNNTESSKSGIHLLWEHAKSAYSRGIVVAWSLWYAASTAGFMQVLAYIQLLWKDIEPGQNNEYNGVVEAILTLLATLSALLAGKMTVKVGTPGLPVLPAVAALLQAGAALTAALAQDVWLSYLGYIILGVIYYYMITVTSAIIARNLVYDSCFGLVFGINTLLSVIIQVVLTLVVISEAGLELDIRTQYKVYAGYYVCLSVIVFATWAYFTIKRYLQVAENNKSNFGSSSQDVDQGVMGELM